jgi:riboflavin synthase alpha subunit
MFTGLVQDVGLVREASPSPAGRRMVIETRHWDRRPAAGDSVCVSGVCLTLLEPGADGALAFDVIGATLSCTTLGSLEAGSHVNIEGSLRAADEIGGHFVQGHIDGVGRVTRVQRDESDWRIAIEPPEWMMDLVVPKGSIAVDGVSLTIASINGGRFEIALIPTTLERTTLGALREGDLCNLEGDILAKTVARLLERRDGATG